MAKFYLTYYEEYPIYEPAEGGYYYSGNQVIAWYEYDNFYDAYRDIKTIAEDNELSTDCIGGDFFTYSTGQLKKDLVSDDGSTLVAGDFTSHYIGERRTLRFETEAGFESDVRGWHPYC